VSLMHLFLSRKLQLPDLKPANVTILLADHSVRCPAIYWKTLQFNWARFVIPCDFDVIDMDDNLQALIILGQPFLSTAGVIIDVAAGRIFFQLCGEKIDFYLLSPKAIPSSAVPPSLVFLDGW